MRTNKNLFEKSIVKTNNREYDVSLKSIGPNTDYFVFGFGERDSLLPYNLIISNFAIESTAASPKFQYDLELRHSQSNDKIEIDDKITVLARNIMRKYYLIFKSHFTSILRYNMTSDMGYDPQAEDSHTEETPEDFEEPDIIDPEVEKENGSIR